MELNICDECKSEYYVHSSVMSGLCPECAHQLYGYPNCSHIFIDGRCTRCHWNGQTSTYMKRGKGGKEKERVIEN